MFALLTLAAVLARAAGQFTVEPSTTSTPATISDCTSWIVAIGSETCQGVATEHALTLDQLHRYNPSFASGCVFVAGTSYCVQENWGIPPPVTPSQSSSSSTTTPTATGNGITTPTPTQTDMSRNCSRFHYIADGQSCGDILALYDLALAMFYSWNVGVGPQCSTMWANVHISTRTSSATTTGGNGISIPTPRQPGMTDSCDKFDLVKQGESCSTLLARNGISLAQLYVWNTGVGSQCEGLWANVYVCVQKIGAPTTTTLKTTTTTTGNGIATPTPTMPGMVQSCWRFYKVVDRDNCDKICSNTGAAKANIIKWNTQVGSSCNVWLDYFICVGI
ncbi:hypothetical protein Micbo1qcDRAFT_182721 [Microdochium bolleyi]|uniref:LysM domain-containing protein n=1 Tax=Microdochium bolleyi TaxID=196109 RepID=A0A136JB59_9PEZI|nr:hypothetical protein Micbo1qcDRAFT_182721 [Microdochium bolleyi]